MSRRSAVVARLIDVGIAVPLSLILAPVGLLIAISIRIRDGAPVLFVQQRVGRDGAPFDIFKFRTMKPAHGLQVTTADDDRVTATGRLIRRYRLDEIPQLINVLLGDMSFVGPRPEVPEFVAAAPELFDETLRHRPGITDPASIAFRNEGDFLAQCDDPRTAYIERVLPAKLARSAAYLEHRTLGSDLRVIFETARIAFGVGEPLISDPLKEI